jgi:hypothetical protein
VTLDSTRVLGWDGMYICRVRSYKYSCYGWGTPTPSEFMFESTPLLHAFTRLYYILCICYILLHILHTVL